MANKSRACNEGSNFMAYLCVRSVFGARAQKAYHPHIRAELVGWTEWGSDSESGSDLGAKWRL